MEGEPKGEKGESGFSESLSFSEFDESTRISGIEDFDVPEGAVQIYFVALDHGDFEEYEFNPFITQAFQDDSTDNMLFYSESFIAYDTERLEMIKGDNVYPLDVWKDEPNRRGHRRKRSPLELVWPTDTNRIYGENLFFESVENPIAGVLTWLIDLEVIVSCSYRDDVVLALYNSHEDRMAHKIRDIQVKDGVYLTIDLFYNYISDALIARPLILEYLDKEEAIINDIAEGDEYRPILDIIRRVRDLLDEEALLNMEELLADYVDHHYQARIYGDSSMIRFRDTEEVLLKNEIVRTVTKGRALLQWFNTTEKFKMVIDTKTYDEKTKNLRQRMKKFLLKVDALAEQGKYAEAEKLWKNKRVSAKIIDIAMEITNMSVRGRDWFTVNRILKLVKESRIRNIVLSVGSSHVSSIREVVYDLDFEHDLNLGLEDWVFLEVEYIGGKDFVIEDVVNAFDYFKDILLPPLSPLESPETRIARERIFGKDEVVKSVKVKSVENDEKEDTDDYW
jgi:hypothetical protein